jgi:hypothetical protein
MKENEMDETCGIVEKWLQNFWLGNRKWKGRLGDWRIILANAWVSQKVSGMYCFKTNITQIAVQ